MTFKINLDKSPHENVIDLIVYSNQDIDLKLDPVDYLLESQVCTEEPGYNAIVQITGLPDAPYTDTDWLFYNRVDLDSLYYRDYSTDDLEEIPKEEWAQFLINSICEESGIMRSQISIKEFVAPKDENDGHIVLVAEDDDLLYTGELLVPVIFIDPEIDLATIIKMTFMYGLNYPINHHILDR